jgi:vacuolar-type H+-ATPase subunit H
MTGKVPGRIEEESRMEAEVKGIGVEHGKSVLADVQARELELERVLEEARGEAGEKMERAKAEAAALVQETRVAIDRRKREKAEAILAGARSEAEAKRREGGASQQALQDRIGAGIPPAVEETVRAILPDGFLP